MGISLRNPDERVTRRPRRPSAKLASRIALIVLEDCTPITPVGLASMFQLANQVAERGGVSQRVEAQLVSATAKPVVRTSVMPIHCTATLASIDLPDILIVPAIDYPITPKLAANRRLTDLLVRAAARGCEVASSCTGAFALAEAGLLNGRTATTHWAYADLLARSYPQVRVAPEAILVDQGGVITSGGASAFLSLAIYLIERTLGLEVARSAARTFLVDVYKMPQHAYAVFAAQKNHGDDAILRAQQRIESDLARITSVAQLAREVAISRRHFARRFKEATGETPKDYLQRLRIEAAKRALESSDASIHEIARRVGYDDVGAFRRTFRSRTGYLPARYRERHGHVARTQTFLVDGEPR